MSLLAVTAGRNVVRPSHPGCFLKYSILNKGTGFSEIERSKMGLRGLLPAAVETLDAQLIRIQEQFYGLEKPMDKYIYLHALKERNEVLFYHFVMSDMTATLPIIYTPTVGEACLKLSHVFRVGEGLYINKSDKGSIRSLLDNWPLADVAIIVVTDGSRILGLGDLGANGMGIPVGKLSLYVAAAGFHPGLTLPIILDFGTNNEALLADPLYLGARHKRLPEEEYLALVEEFVTAVQDKWPHCVLQFEDFSNDHCFKLLDIYRDRCLCFNDDIQGTGAVIAAGFLNAVKLSKVPLMEQKVVVFGAGSAGVGVANQIALTIQHKTGCSLEEARERFWFVDSRGLVTTTRGDVLEQHKIPFARKDAQREIKQLDEVIKYVKPTALIGLSAQSGAFTAEILQDLCNYTARPIVFPLSNPTRKAECTAVEAYTRTNGNALFASGSPFEPVQLNGKTYYPGQGNNMYIFPGLGLGSWICQARKVTDEMITSAMETLADLTSDADLSSGRLYPEISRIREISTQIAINVIKMAYKQNVAKNSMPADIDSFVREHMWIPKYEPLE